MTNAFVTALKHANNETTTENGMASFKSTTNPLVNLFYEIGATRGRIDDVLPTFQQACAKDLDIAVRILLHARDAREGMGERQHFRDMLYDLAIRDYTSAVKVIKMVPEIGRWDDLFCLLNTPAEKEMLDFYANALNEGNGLAAKWAPREKSSKKAVAMKIMKHMKLSSKQYRKLLTSNTDVVETTMSDQKWGDVDYNKVPSLAHLRYTKAFKRHDGERHYDYVNSLERGEEGVKINAGVLYPHNIVQQLDGCSEQVRVLEQQWKALPDFIGEGSFIPVSDVSGSMFGLPMDVSIALGMYCAQRNKSAFKNMVFTFSNEPTIVNIEGLSLKEAFEKVNHADWGFNTDIEATFDMILDIAVENHVRQEDLPKFLVIFSDMQFDEASNSYRDNISAHKMIKEQYESRGYKMPQIIYWNLNARNGGVPVLDRESGALLVSGFSPSLMKSVLSMTNYDPLQAVLEIVGVERYHWQQ